MTDARPRDRDDSGAARSRRRFLGGLAVAATAAVAGCSGLLGKKPMRLRATPAEGDETDVRCRLSAEFVNEHSKLETVLQRAGGNERGEWATMGVSEERGNAVGDALVDHCDGNTRGLYEHDGQWYFVSLSYRDAEDHQDAEGGHTHENETGHTH